MNLRDDLKAYLDGELEPVRAEEVRSALERDPELRRELAELRSISTTLKVHAAEIVPQGLERTLSALNGNQKSSPVATYRWGWTMGLCAAAVLVGILLVPTFNSARIMAKNPLGARLAKLDDRASNAPADSQYIAPPAARAPATMAKSRPKMEERTKASTQHPTVWFETPRKRTKALSGSSRIKQIEGIVADRVPVKSPASMVALNGGTSNGLLKPSVSATSTTTGTIALATPPPVTVSLSFASPDAGAKEVLAVVGKYEVFPAEMKTKKVPSSSAGNTRTIAVDLPEEQADKLIADLKKLPDTQAPATLLGVSPARNTFANSVGGAGGGMGGQAGRAGGGFGGGGFGGEIGGAVSKSDTASARGASANRAPTAQSSRGPMGGGADGKTATAATAGAPGGKVQNVVSNQASIAAGSVLAGQRAVAKDAAAKDAVKMAPARELRTKLQSRVIAQAKKTAGRSDSLNIDGFHSSGAVTKPRVRRVLIVIEVKPKQEPVP